MSVTQTDGEVLCPVVIGDERDARRATGRDYRWYQVRGTFDSGIESQVVLHIVVMLDTVPLQASARTILLIGPGLGEQDSGIDAARLAR